MEQLRDIKTGRFLRTKPDYKALFEEQKSLRMQTEVQLSKVEAELAKAVKDLATEKSCRRSADFTTESVRRSLRTVESQLEAALRDKEQYYNLFAIEQGRTEKLRDQIKFLLDACPFWTSRKFHREFGQDGEKA